MNCTNSLITSNLCMAHRKRKYSSYNFSFINKLPAPIVQLIWEFLPIYHGLLFALSNKEINQTLSKEVASVKLLRKIVTIDGMCVDKDLCQIRSTRKAYNFSFHVAALPYKKAKLAKVCEAIRFLMRPSEVKNVEFINGMCPLVFKRFIANINCKTRHSFDTISLHNAFAYTSCTHQARLSLMEFAKLKTTKIDIVESCIADETLSCLFIAMARMKGLSCIRMYKTWIDKEYMSGLSITLSKCSEVSVTKCGLTTEHALILFDSILTTSRITTLELSNNRLGCRGLNNLFSAFSEANMHLLQVLELENTCEYVDDEHGFQWNIKMFQFFCKSQSNLRLLNLSGNYMNDDFIQDNVKAIKSLKKLKNFQFAANFISDGGLHKLSTIDNKLTHLDLNENPISKINVTHFSNRLFHYVEELNLGNNHISNASLINIAQVANLGYAFKGIRQLSMENCCLTDSHIYLLFELITQLPQLVVMDLEKNEMTDYAHQYFCDELENIKGREICIVLLQNWIAFASEVPKPHSILV